MSEVKRDENDGPQTLPEDRVKRGHLRAFVTSYLPGLTQRPPPAHPVRP
jgi:hypothetical protein